MAPKGNEVVDNSNATTKDATKSKTDPGKDDGDNLSEEDRELKERLETCVETVQDVTTASIPIRSKALDMIVTELRTATASMTSVPKPLKFLRPKYDVLKEVYESETTKITSSSDKETLKLHAKLADVLAVLAMTMGKPEGACVWMFFSFEQFIYLILLSMLCHTLSF